MSVNPYEPPRTDLTSSAETDEPASYRHEKLRLLLWMLALFTVSGFIEGISAPIPEVSLVLNLLVSLGFGVLILRWCHYDRLELNQRRWRFFAPMMIALPGPAIMVPIYLLRSRGLTGIVSVVLALLFLILLIAASLLGVLLGFVSSGEMSLHDFYFSLSWP